MRLLRRPRWRQIRARFKRNKKGGLQSAPPRQWAIDVVVGAAILTVGAAGVVALLITAGTATVIPPLWGTDWFLAAISFFGLLTALGLYMLAAVYFRLPLPQTRAARETRAEFTVGEITMAKDTTTVRGSGLAIVHLPVFVGRLDVDNATMNVRVPDFVKIAPCNAAGTEFRPEHASMDHTSESLYADKRHESNYLVLARMHFSAFTAQPMYFRLTYTPPVEPFPLSVRITAAALHGAVETSATITPQAIPRARLQVGLPESSGSSGRREDEPAPDPEPGEGEAPTPA